MSTDNLVSLPTVDDMVEQVIDEDVHTVAVHLALPDLLTQVARAVVERHLMDEVLILGVQPLASPRAGLAQRTLLADPAIRDALTIRVQPDDAENLGHALLEAAADPPRCEQHNGPWQQRDYCPNFATHGDRCPVHAEPDDGDVDADERWTA